MDAVPTCYLPWGFGGCFFLNAVWNLHPGFRILTSLLSILKGDAWPLSVLISDGNNLIAEARLCDCSFLYFALGKWKGNEDALWWANYDLVFSSPLPSHLPTDSSESLTDCARLTQCLSLHLSCSVPSDLQGAAQYQGCPSGCGDLDWEGSHRHHHQPCADAPWILQIPAAAYQTARRCCASHLVRPRQLWFDVGLYPFIVWVKFYINISVLN